MSGDPLPSSRTGTGDRPKKLDQTIMVGLYEFPRGRSTVLPVLHPQSAGSGFRPVTPYLAGCSACGVHRVTQPPENGKVWPTKKSLSSPARNKANAADSHPCANRPIGAALM